MFLSVIYRVEYLLQHINRRIAGPLHLSGYEIYSWGFPDFYTHDCLILFPLLLLPLGSQRPVGEVGCLASLPVHVGISVKMCFEVVFPVLQDLFSLYMCVSTFYLLQY